VLPPSECYDLLTPVLWTKSFFNGSKLRSYFSPFVDQSSPDYLSRRGGDRSLQRRFPVVDSLFRSGNIRDRSAKSSEIAPKSVFFCLIFWGEDPKFWAYFFKKIAPISDHVAKFRGDRRRDRGDLAMKKNKKAYLTQRKRATAVRVWRPLAKKSTANFQLMVNSNRGSITYGLRIARYFRV